MTEVFISYARSTEREAEQVERALAAEGYAVWRDSALPIHRVYAEVIEERLGHASAVVVLWSRDAVKSEWVRSEANRARELGKLVQISLDKTLPPMPFDQLHCADLQGWTGASAPGWTKVLESVAHLAGAEPAPRLLASHHHDLTVRPTRTEPLLAVLAFDNLSGDPDFLYFSDGVSDEILHTVAHTTDLRVVARSSSFQLRGAGKAAASVAAQLNATHLLDGSVRRSGERVRVTAQLIECAGQTTLWSDRFDRDLSDIFALQDEIAGAVAEALKSAFAPRDAGAIDAVAYDLYLRARELDPSRFSFDTQLLDEAVARAPGFLQAWESLTITHAANARYSLDAAAFPMRLAKMEAAAERALALDPRSVAAHFGKSMTAPICGAFLEAEQLLAQALSVAPTDAFILDGASAAAAVVGRNRVALAYVTQAYEVDPLHPLTAGWFAAQLATNGRHKAACARFDDAVARWPDNGFVRTTAIGKAIEMRDWARVDRYAAVPDDVGIYTAWVAVLVQAASEMRDWTPELSARHLSQNQAILAATGTIYLSPLGYLCGQGLTDEVYALVEQASFAHLFQPGGRLLTGDVAMSLLFEPSAQPLREDVRFVRLCGRLGLCDYWIATDRWPDCAEELAPFYDFRAEARIQVPA